VTNSHNPWLLPSKYKSSNNFQINYEVVLLSKDLAITPLRLLCCQCINFM